MPLSPESLLQALSASPAPVSEAPRRSAPFDINEAVAAAGRDARREEEFGRRRKRSRQFLTGERPTDNTFDDLGFFTRQGYRVSEAAGSTLRGLVNIIGSASQGISQSAAILEKGVTGDFESPEEKFFFKLGNAIKGLVPEGNPELQDELLSRMLPEALGSIGAFVATRGLSAAAGGSSFAGTAATALTGAGVGGASFYEEARANGLSEEAALDYSGIMNMVGASEVVLPERLFSRISKASSPVKQTLAKRVFHNYVESALTEGGQELFQGSVSHAIKAVESGDADGLVEGFVQALDDPDVVRQGLIGALAGAGFSGVVDVAISDPVQSGVAAIDRSVRRARRDGRFTVEELGTAQGLQDLIDERPEEVQAIVEAAEGGQVSRRLFKDIIAEDGARPDARQRSDIATNLTTVIEQIALEERRQVAGDSEEAPIIPDPVTDTAPAEVPDQPAPDEATAQETDTVEESPANLVEIAQEESAQEEADEGPISLEDEPSLDIVLPQEAETGRASLTDLPAVRRLQETLALEEREPTRAELSQLAEELAQAEGGGQSVTEQVAALFRENQPSFLPSPGRQAALAAKEAVKSRISSRRNQARRTAAKDLELPGVQELKEFYPLVHKNPDEYFTDQQRAAEEADKRELSRIEDDLGAQQDAFIGKAASLERLVRRARSRPLSNTSIIKAIEKKTGFPIRKGRLGPQKKGVRGVYFGLKKMVRLMRGSEGDLAVTSHEIAHGYDDRYDITAPISEPGLIEELDRLDYYHPHKKRPDRVQAKREGFAEFLRHYLSTGDDTSASQQIAPKTYEFFTQTVLPRMGDDTQVIAEIRELIDEYRAQSPRDTLRGKIAKNPNRPERAADETRVEYYLRGANDIFRKNVQLWIDSNDPVFEVFREAKRAGSKDAEQMITQLQALNGSSSAMGMWAFQNGVFNPSRLSNSGQAYGFGFKDVVKRAGLGDKETFQAWVEFIYARHAVEAHGKGINPGVDLKTATSVYSELHSDAFEDAAKMFTSMLNDSVRLLADVGRITRDEADRMIDTWETYIPLKRRPNSLADAVNKGRAGGSFLDASAAIKRRYGSEAQIVDPFTSAVQTMLERYKIATQHMVLSDLVRLAKNNTIPGIVTIVPASKAREIIRGKQLGKDGEVEVPLPGGQTVTLPVSVDITTELADSELQALGIDPATFGELIAPEAQLSVWKTALFESERNAVVRMIDESGQEVLAEFDKEVYDAIRSMGGVKDGLFTEMASKITGLQRLGATGLSGRFAAGNVPRDVLNLFFIRKYGKNIVAKWLESFAPGHDFGVVPDDSQAIGDMVVAELVNAPSAFFDSVWNISSITYNDVARFFGKEISGGQLELLYRQWGGDMATLLGNDVNQMKRFQRTATADTATRRVLNIVKHPSQWIDLARDAIAITEIGPRLTEFGHALQTLGYDVGAVDKGQVLPTPSDIQLAIAASKDLTDYTRKGEWGRQANKHVAFFNAAVQSLDKYGRFVRGNPRRTAVRFAMLASATALYWLTKKDEDWYQEAPPWLKYGFWTYTDQEGNPVARIPRSYEAGLIFSAGVESMLNAWNDRDPEHVNRWFNSMARKNVPPYMPAYLEAPVGYMFNWDFFRQHNTVPAYLVSGSSAVQPQLQYTPKTTGVFRSLGSATGTSPAKMEQAFEVLTGGLTTKIARAADGIMEGKNPFSTGNVADAAVIGGFAFRRDYNESVSEFYERRENLRKQINSTKLRGGQPGVEQRAELALLDQYAGVFSTLREEVRQRQETNDIRDIEKWMIGLARHAEGKEPLRRYPNPLTSQNAPDIVSGSREKLLGTLVKWKTDTEPATKDEKRLLDFQVRLRASQMLDDMGISRPEQERLLLERFKGESVVLKSGAKSSLGKRLEKL